MRLHLSVELPPSVSPRLRFAAIASLVVAALVAFASIGGIVLPSVYAQETAGWRIQGIGQDWVDLILAAPWLAITAALVLRGSRRARLLLAGGLLYVAYSFVIYAFAVHFNALFMIYCAILGGSAFALYALGAGLARDEVRGWFGPRVPRRVVGGFQIGVAVAFAVLWLSQVVPALVRGTAPPEVNELGLITNPVHILDLSVVLPLVFIGGLGLWRRRPIGLVLAPIMLGFELIMDVNLVGLVVAAWASGQPAATSMLVAFGVLFAVATAMLVAMMRAVRPPDTGRAELRLDVAA